MSENWTPACEIFPQKTMQVMEIHNANSNFKKISLKSNQTTNIIIFLWITLLSYLVTMEWNL